MGTKWEWDELDALRDAMIQFDGRADLAAMSPEEIIRQLLLSSVGSCTYDLLNAPATTHVHATLDVATFKRLLERFCPEVRLTPADRQDEVNR